MSAVESHFSDDSTFVQFALGIAGNQTFKTLLLYYGVPFALSCLVILLAYAIGIRPFRVTTWLAKHRRFTHPAQAVWLSTVYWLLLVGSIVMLGIWGVRTAAEVKPAMFGVGIILLIPSFFFGISGFLLWRSRGWRLYEYAVPQELQKPMTSGMATTRILSMVYRIASNWISALRRTIQPIPFCFFMALMLFTGYELCVVFNGDTVHSGSGSQLTTEYHYSYLAVTWVFVTYNMIFVIFAVNVLLEAPGHSSVPLLVAAALGLKQAAQAPVAAAQEPTQASRVPGLSALKLYVQAATEGNVRSMSVEELCDDVDVTLAGKPSRLLRVSALFSKRWWRAGAWYVCSLAVLGAYAAINFLLASNDPASGKYLCFPTIGTIVLLDIIASLMYAARIVQTPGGICFILTGARIGLIAYGTRYWLLGQCTVYVVTALYVAHVMVQQRIARAIAKNSTTGFWGSLIASANGVSSFSFRNVFACGASSSTASTTSATAAAAANTPHNRFRWISWVATPEAILCIHTSCFAALIAGLAVAMNRHNSTLPNAMVPTLQASVQQFAFGIGALCVVAVWLCTEILLTVYFKGQKMLRDAGWVFAALSWLVVAACGVGLYFATASYVLLFAGIFSPMLLIPLFAMYGQWIRDDFMVLPGGLSVSSRFIPSCLRRRGDPAAPASTVAAAPNPMASPAASLSGSTTTAAIQSKNWLMVLGALCILGSLLGFGFAVSATVAPSYVGWMVSGAIGTVVFTAVPITQWFQTLEYSHFQPVCLLIALGLHAAVHATMLAAHSASTKVTVGIAFSLCLYPSIVLLLVALYKWWDDKWKATKFVKICIAISQAIIFGFAIAAVIVYRDDVTAPAAILGTYTLLSCVGVLLAIWVKNRFFLPRRWNVMAGIALLLVFVGGFLLCIWEYFGHNRADRAVLWFSVGYWALVIGMAAKGIADMRQAGAYSMVLGVYDSNSFSPVSLLRRSLVTPRGASPQMQQSGAGAMPLPRTASVEAPSSSTGKLTLHASNTATAAGATSCSLLYFSPQFFPVYSFDPNAGNLRPAHSGPYLLIGAALLGLVWGCLAMVFIVPIYAGVMVTNVVKLLLVLFICDAMRRGNAELAEAIGHLRSYGRMQSDDGDDVEMKVIKTLMTAPAPPAPAGANTVVVNVGGAAPHSFASNPIANWNRVSDGSAAAAKAAAMHRILRVVYQNAVIASVLTDTTDKEADNGSRGTPEVKGVGSASPEDSGVSLSLTAIYSDRYHVLRSELASLLAMQVMMEAWSPIQLTFPSTPECRSALFNRTRVPCGEQPDGTALWLAMPPLNATTDNNTGAPKQTADGVATAADVPRTQFLANVDSARIQYASCTDMFAHIRQSSTKKFGVLRRILNDITSADECATNAYLRGELFSCYVRHGIIGAGLSAAAEEFAQWKAFLAWLSEADRLQMVLDLKLNDVTAYHAILTGKAPETADGRPFTFTWPKPSATSVTSRTTTVAFWQRHLGLEVANGLEMSLMTLFCRFHVHQQELSAELERRRKIDEEAQRLRDAMERQRAEEERRRRAEEEAARLAAEEAAKAGADATRRAAEEAERQAQLARIRAQQEADERIRQQIAAAEAQARAAAEEAAHARRLREEAEALAKSQEAARLAAEREAADIRRRQQEEADRARAGMERMQREKVAMEAARQAALAAAAEQQRRLEEERRAREAAEAAAALRAQREMEAAEALRKQQEEFERLRRRKEEAELQRRQMEAMMAEKAAAEEARRRAEAELAARRQAEEAARRNAELARQKAEAEAARMRQAELDRQRVEAEQLRQQQLEQERLRRLEDQRRREQAEAAQRRREEEAAQKAAMEAAERERRLRELAAEQERKRQAEEAARLQREKAEREAAAALRRKQEEELRLREQQEAERRRKEQEEAAAAAAARIGGAGGADVVDSHAIQMRAKIDEIARACVAKGTRFEDGWSGPKALVGLEKGVKYAWARLPEIHPSMTVYDDGYNACDISQGGLGDCYLLSALSVLASNPGLLDDVLLTSDVSPAGVYGVRMWKQGQWQELILDDKMAVHTDRYLDLKEGTVYAGRPDVARKQFYVPSFVKSKTHKEAWMMLLEKAYAKYYGSFKRIEGGWVHSALCDFVPGSVGEMITMTSAEVQRQIKSGALWKKLQDYVAKGFLLGAGSPAGSDTDVSRAGIVQGHAYSILRVAEESDASGAYQLVQLRNPWGGTEWNGAWSDKDTTRWTRRMQNKLNYRPNEGGGEDGVFWMAWSDFTVHFEDIYVCRIFKLVGQPGGEWYRYTVSGSWRGVTAGGCPNPSNAATCPNNPQYYIMPSKPCTINVSLQQVLGAGKEPATIGLKVLNKGGKRVKAVYSGESVMQASYCAMAECTAEGYLTPAAQPYTLFVSTYEPREERDFFITIYSDQPLEMTDGPTLMQIPTTVPAS